MRINALALDSEMSCDSRIQSGVIVRSQTSERAERATTSLRFLTVGCGGVCAENV